MMVIFAVTTRKGLNINKNIYYYWQVNSPLVNELKKYLRGTSNLAYPPRNQLPRNMVNILLIPDAFYIVTL